MKNITIVPAAGGSHVDLTIAPGTTPRNIRQQLGLDDRFILTQGRGAEAFGDDENIYPLVPDGSKLYASTPVEVGGLLDLLNELAGISAGRNIAHLIDRSPPSTPVLIRPTTSGLSGRIVVQRPPTPYWQERGWARTGEDYQGYYRTCFGSWKGKAEVSLSGKTEMFIHDPPRKLEDHDAWHCFRKRKGGWYFIHTCNDHDVSSGILRVERILNEALAL